MTSLRDVHRTLSRVLLLTLAACSSAAWLGSHLVLNSTSSLPRGLYWIQPGRTPDRGDLVLTPVPSAVAHLALERGYVPPHTPLLKKLVALPGDHVCTNDHRYVVNGRFLGAILTADSQGRPIPHHDVCAETQPSELYLAGAHPLSFDSRVFGPIHPRQILATASPVWIF